MGGGSHGGWGCFSNLRFEFQRGMHRSVRMVTLGNRATAYPALRLGANHCLVSSPQYHWRPNGLGK